MSGRKFKYEAKTGAEDVAGYLESLAAGIREREVHLESGNEFVSLRVSDDVSFECDAKENTEKGRSGFTLSVEWRSLSQESARPLRQLHVVPASMMVEEEEFASDFADREDSPSRGEQQSERVLVPASARTEDRDSASAPDDEPAPRQPVRAARPSAPRPRSTRTTASSRKPAASVRRRPSSSRGGQKRTASNARKPIVSVRTRSSHGTGTAKNRTHARRRAAS